MKKVLYLRFQKTKVVELKNKNALVFSAFTLSGQKDSNLRPPAPKADAHLL